VVRVGRNELLCPRAARVAVPAFCDRRVNEVRVRRKRDDERPSNRKPSNTLNRQRRLRLDEAVEVARERRKE